MTDKTSALKRLKPEHRAECTVTFDEAQVAPAEAKALIALGQNVKMAGFREGKVPVEMLREKIDPARLFEETIRTLLPATFDSLITEHNLHPIIPPRVEAVSREPLTLKIVFVEKPAVKLKGVEKIKIEKKKPDVEDKDVERMVDYVLKQHQHTHHVERAAQKDDRVTMDFWGADEAGNEIPEIRSTGYRVVIGSQTLLPGFEDALVGMKESEEKAFSLVFPEKYHAEQLRNKPVTFHVTIKEVEEVHTPVLDDKFAKESLQAESAEAFRTQIRESMVKQEEDIERKRREELLLDAIREATVVDLGPELEEDEIRSLFEELEEQLRGRNMSIKEWLEKSGQKPEEVQADMRDKGIKRLTLRLGLQQLVETKGVDITEEEMKSIITEFLSPLSGNERTDMAAAYEPGQRAYEQLKWQTKVERVLNEMLA